MYVCVVHIYIYIYIYIYTHVHGNMIIMEGRQWQRALRLVAEMDPDLPPGVKARMIMALVKGAAILTIALAVAVVVAIVVTAVTVVVVVVVK